MQADLRGAYLRRADLRGADLDEGRLEQSQIDEARGDKDTKLPDRLNRPAEWLKE
jgi:uncharacterized protein YjbI with pentapeptide repeats